MDASPVIAPGSQVESGGVRFSVYSSAATEVELCLFDAETDAAESRRIPLTGSPSGLWTVFVPEEKPGRLYGFRVSGPFDPARGLFCNPGKIVIDPCARALGRAPVWDERLFGHSRLDPAKPDPHDNAPVAPLARIVDTTFDWEGDAPPDIPWEETILYETHVKSITARHPQVPEELRGGYLGLASDAVLDHLKSLGVTAVELLPVHQAFDEWHCVHHGLTNYWGYNTLLPFAPDRRFARHLPEDPVTEFKMMVRALHRAGLEVILDVVYNHTAEGGVHGPQLSFRGLDNPAYYRQDPQHPGAYMDFTGCGNSWNMDHPVARRLVLDSLRYWVTEMHVDGFRFDLATVLARGKSGFDPHHPFFKEIADDEVLSRVKLIAEPWDLGPGGYQLAAFPREWSEWNDQYRNVARRFWRGDPGQTGLFARRVSGSEDIYGPKNKPPRSSINFVTCHDGFTLHDLVSYNRKHNEDNQESNRDGNDQNFSMNFGEEGPTLNTKILNRRYRQKRNMMASLLLSQGTPMLLGGDELGKTQRGNNNTWCQDNDLNWYHWALDDDQKRFLEFVRNLVRIRKSYPFFQRGAFFTGKKQPGGFKDLCWLHPGGREMEKKDWESPATAAFGMQVSAEDNESLASLVILVNADVEQTVNFQLPPVPAGGRWSRLLDTTEPEETPEVDDAYLLKAMSLAVLKGGDAD